MYIIPTLGMTSLNKLTAYETGGLCRGFEGSRLGKGIPGRSHTEGQSRWTAIQGSQGNFSGVPQGSFLGSLPFLV